VIQKVSHLASSVCWCTVSLEGVKVKLFSQVRESDHFFMVAMVKLQQFVISEADKVRHRRRAAIQQLSTLVAVSLFVLVAHYDISITSRLAKNI